MEIILVFPRVALCVIFYCIIILKKVHVSGFIVFLYVLFTSIRILSLVDFCLLCDYDSC
jgi:hypothetical protein